MARNRTPISKRTRFDIFKRDHFTCQYCGKQPPEVVLVVDHIIPFCNGGSGEMENLLTACEACNQCKAGIQLSVAPVRPDADLMYLETQQETAELIRYRYAKNLRDAELEKIVKLLQDTWASYLSDDFDWCPADHILRSMLNKYNPEVVEAGIVVTARAIQTGYVSSHGQNWLKYAWGVMKNSADQED